MQMEESFFKALPKEEDKTAFQATPQQEAAVQRELIRGIVDMTRHKEFYGHIVQQFERVLVKGNHAIQTAAVGRNPGDRFIKLYLNTDFFIKIFESKGQETGWKQMQGVLEHEVLHIVFGHLFLVFQDRTRGNVAVDLVVNSYIPKEKLPENCCFPDTYGFEEGKSALWYYTHLQGNAKYQSQCKNGSFGIGGIMSHVASSHSKWEDIADDPVAQEFAKDIVRKSKDMCNNQYGDIHGDIVSQIDALLKREKPVIPWAKVLRMFVASCSESSLDYTIKKISKRFNCRPGTRKEDVLEIAVAIDTSGSISESDLSLFFNEIRWIWKNGCKVTIYEADCAVCAVYPFKGKFNGNVHGRGGTDLEPALIAVDKKRFDALIYFTDFYAPEISKQYKTPTLWVLTSEMEPSSYPAKWGKHIKIGNGRPEKG
jgi:predicted metal-dependent peptidase